MPNPAPLSNFGSIYMNLNFLENKSMTLGLAPVCETHTQARLKYVGTSLSNDAC